MMVTIDEEGEARVRDVFVLSSPITGQARRIKLEVGDLVVARETVAAEIQPVDPATTTRFAQTLTSNHGPEINGEHKPAAVNGT